MQHAKIQFFSILSLMFTTALTSYARSNPQGNTPSNPQPGERGSSERGLTLSLSGLEPLANGFHYEGWAIIDGMPISTGKFNVRPNGQLTGVGGAAVRNGNNFKPAATLSRTSDIVITIEAAGDRDQNPSNTKVLAGPVSNGKANLNVMNSNAIGVNFGTASGGYILATPTDGGMNTNEKSGIWFIDSTSGMPMPGLKLPMLPGGWNYEGWVIFDGMPLTSGKFTMPNMADFMAPFSGPAMGPPFPGEDYLQSALQGLTFPTDLSGRGVVITVEPDPDDSEEPFRLAPLGGTVPSPAADHTFYTLQNQADMLPSGQARIVL